MLGRRAWRRGASMAQAPQYNPATDFSQDETNNVSGRSTVRTAMLDAELSALQTSINALCVNQALNQRDDGEIRDQRVKLFSLASDVLALLTVYGATPRGPWVTVTLYSVKDLVSQGGNTYMCVTAHISGTFATDLAAGKWILFTLGTSIGASSVTFTPTGTIAATDVQAAIAESDSENRALSAAASAAATAYDVAMRADLADGSTSGKGTSLLGWLRALTSSVATTLKSWLGWQEINAFEFMTVAQIASFQASDGALDHATPLQAWINACAASAASGGKLVGRLPAGGGRVGSTLTVPGSVVLRGQGVNSLLK